VNHYETVTEIDRWYFRFRIFSCRIARYKLSSLLLLVLAFAALLAMWNREKRKPKSVMSSASMVFVTVNSDCFWVAFRPRSPRAWKEFAAVASLTENARESQLDIKDYNRDQVYVSGRKNVAYKKRQLSTRLTNDDFLIEGWMR